MDIIGSSFTDNYVSDAASWTEYWNFANGGGVYIYGEARISLRSSIFRGNGAEHGGGTAFLGNHTVTVENCLFDENLSNNEGGGMMVAVS